MTKITRINPYILPIRKKIRVAAYARVSVDYDKGVTGTKINRPGFKELMYQCEIGQVDMIITKSISRFTRNTVDLLDTVRSLKEKCINVYFERENINTNSQDGELLLTLLASFAQEESRSISENTKWAIRKRYEEGFVNSFFLFGYRWNGKDFIIEETEAKAVKLIFNSYLEGMSPDAIAKMLNDKNIKPYKSEKFNYSSIWKILRQLKYTGDCILQETFIENHLTHKKKINQGELPKYYVEGTHPIIIEKELFNKVQGEIKRRKALGYRANQSLTFNCFTSNFIALFVERLIEKE